jgi:hypothetical protein
METAQINILLVVAGLAIIILIMLFLSQKDGNKKLSFLAGLAFAFIIAGIIFGGNKLLGYGLIGTGIILSIVDIIIKSRKN